MDISITDKLDFENLSLRYPVEIVNEYIPIIKEQTHDYVLLGVHEYSESLDEDGVPMLAASLRAIVELTQGTSVQDKLGKINDDGSRYEVFFYSDVLDQYKYRLMFLEYGIGGYPAKVYIANEIVRSIIDDNQVANLQIVTGDEELVKLLDCIFSSPFVLQIIQEIINATKHKRYLNAKSVEE